MARAKRRIRRHRRRQAKNAAGCHLDLAENGLVHGAGNYPLFFRPEDIVEKVKRYRQVG